MHQAAKAGVVDRVVYPDLLWREARALANKALAPQVKGCDWQKGFTFTDFVRTRAYDATDIKPFILPGVLRFFDVDEL